MCNGAKDTGGIIVAGAEYGILKITGGGEDSLKSALTKGSYSIGHTGNLQRRIGPALTQQHGIGAGDDAAIGIDDAKGAIGNILKLKHDAMENTVRHDIGLLKKCINTNSIKLYD
jgi:hypothetical protein